MIEKAQRGIVAPITALLLIGLVAFAIMLFLPSHMRVSTFNAEKSHMKSVRDSFREIHRKVDEISSGESKSIEIQMSTASSLLVRNPVSAGVLSLTGGSGNSFGTIGFSIRNQYYPSQTYFFECGGVILKQRESTYMLFEPNTITAFDLDSENIRVNFDKVLILGENSWISKKGLGIIDINAEEFYYKERPNDEPNRENVVVNLENKIKPDCENAWKRYLKNLESKLNGKGYDATLDGLELTINGKGTGKDIYYYERVKKIKVSIS